MGFFGNSAAEDARDRFNQAQNALNAKLASRQPIVNPYAHSSDLSGMISNPFANLQVATAAAEFQAEESDLALASTLDTLRATGAGAGGATTLAQAALRSKAGVSASIAQQEARNEQLRAQGEQKAIQMRMTEAERLQNADMLGRQYMFDAQEQRDVADISRLSAMSQQFAQQEMDAQASRGNLLGTVISAVGGPIAGAVADELFK
jgi:hypothetical protein